MQLLRAGLFLMGFATLTMFASDICIVGPMSYEYTAKKGEQISCKVKVANNSKQTKEVKFTLYDYPITDGGVTHYPEAGSDERSNSSWVQMPSSKVAISASSVYEAEFKINLPKDTDVAGTYNCILMVEPAVSSVKLEDSDKASVRSILRYAIHLVTNIQDTGSYDLKVVDKWLEKKEEKSFYCVTLENTGTLRFRPNIHADFFTDKGEKKEEVNLNPMWLFPGKKRTYRFDVTEFEKGSYHALVVVDQKGADFFGCKCSFDIKSE